MGSFIVVCPKLLCGKFLDLTNRFEQILAEPVIAHGAVVTLDRGVLLRLAGLDVFNADIVVVRPTLEHITDVFRANIAADDLWRTTPFNDTLERANHALSGQGEVDFDGRSGPRNLDTCLSEISMGFRPRSPMLFVRSTAHRVYAG